MGLQTSTLLAKEGIELDWTKIMGRWYEVCRINWTWEPKELKNVTADYTLREDGTTGSKTIDVVNSGELMPFNTRISAKAVGVVDSKLNGVMQVDFGYGKGLYIVLAAWRIGSVQDNYSHILVAGQATNTLWLLSRTIIRDQVVLDKFKQIIVDIIKAHKFSYDVDHLVFTVHDP
jgi:lipocalin